MNPSNHFLEFLDRSDTADPQMLEDSQSALWEKVSAGFKQKRKRQKTRNKLIGAASAGMVLLLIIAGPDIFNTGKPISPSFATARHAKLTGHFSMIHLKHVESNIAITSLLHDRVIYKKGGVFKNPIVRDSLLDASSPIVGSVQSTVNDSSTEGIANHTPIQAQPDVMANKKAGVYTRPTNLIEISTMIEKQKAMPAKLQSDTIKIHRNNFKL